MYFPAFEGYRHMVTFTPSSNQTNNSKDGLFRENLVSNESLLKVAVIRRL